MSKPKMYGQKTGYVPNAKADMRHHKKIYQCDREKAFRQQEIKAKQANQKQEPDNGL